MVHAGEQRNAGEHAARKSANRHVCCERMLGMLGRGPDPNCGVAAACRSRVSGDATSFGKGVEDELPHFGCVWRVGSEEQAIAAKGSWVVKRSLQQFWPVLVRKNQSIRTINWRYQMIVIFTGSPTVKNNTPETTRSSPSHASCDGGLAAAGQRRLWGTTAPCGEIVGVRHAQRDSWARSQGQVAHFETRKTLTLDRR